MYLNGTATGLEAFVRQVFGMWDHSAPLVIFATNTSRLRDHRGTAVGPKGPVFIKDGGTAFADYITRHGLGTVTSQEAPDNGVHLGSGPVRCWTWLVDYPAVAKHVWERGGTLAGIAATQNNERQHYLNFANRQGAGLTYVTAGLYQKPERKDLTF
jgi:hypothetical protein